MTSLLGLLPTELLVQEIGRRLDESTLILLCENLLLPSLDTMIDLWIDRLRDCEFSTRRNRLLAVCWRGKRKAIACLVVQIALKRPELFDLYGFHRLYVHMIHRDIPQYALALKRCYEEKVGGSIRHPWFAVTSKDFKLIGRLLHAIKHKVDDVLPTVEMIYRRFHCCLDEVVLRLHQSDPKLLGRTDRMWNKNRLERKGINKSAKLWRLIYLTGEQRTLMTALDNESETNKQSRMKAETLIYGILITNTHYEQLGQLGIGPLMNTLQDGQYMIQHDPPSFLGRRLTPAQLKELQQHARKRGLDRWVDQLSPSH